MASLKRDAKYIFVKSKINRKFARQARIGFTTGADSYEATASVEASE